MTDTTLQTQHHTHIAMPEDAWRLEGELALKHGGTLHVRALRPDDTERLRALHARLSPETIIFRFFRVLPQLSPEMARHFTHLDYENRMALIAATGQAEDEEIVAVVRYERTGPETAEVAFVVEDKWQGQGIAGALLRRLAGYARARGIRELVAITMATNTRMIELLRHSGFPLRFRYASSELEGTLDISAEPNRA